MLSQRLPKITEAVLLFYGIAYVRSCMQDRRFHAEVHGQTESRAGLPVQLNTRAWSVLKNSVGLELIEAA